MSIPLKELSFSIRYMEVVEGLLLKRQASPGVLLDALRLSEQQLREPLQTINGEQYQRALLAALPYCLPGRSVSAQFLDHIPFTILGPLGFLIMASETFGEVLDHLERYASVIFPAYTMRRDVVRDEVHVLLERLSDFGPVDDLLTEMVVGLFAKCGVFLVSPMRGLEAHLRHAPLTPPFDAEALGFDRVVHVAPVDKIVMPRSLMAASIATRSPVLRAEATRALDDIVRRHGQLRPVSQEAARTIRTLMEQRKLLRADLIAEQMGVSRRTLSRRLEEEGTTLAQLMLDVRLAYADTLLLSTEWSVGDIAGRAGYSNLTNFTRAFRRRYACAPSERRQRRHGA
jgi:AraC-like DNA-binding protein